MVQAELYPVGFFGIHKIKRSFLKLKSYLGLFKKLGNYIESSYMSPEASEGVSDNLEITKLSHDCRTICKNFREIFFLTYKIDFFANLRDGHISLIFRRSAKKLKFLTSNVPKNFSRGQNDAHVQGIEKVRLGQGFPTH